MEESVLSFSVLLRCANTRGENSNKFLSLDQEWTQSFRRNELNSGNETQPASDFFQFFEANAKLVNKILQ